MKNRKIKIPKDFFHRPAIKIIEQKHGEIYSILYLKLACLTVSNDYQITNTVEELAILTNTNVDTLKAILEVLEKYELIKDGKVIMMEVEAC